MPRPPDFPGYVGLLTLVCLTALGVPTAAHADKLDVLGGFYDLKASQTGKTGTDSGIGAYQFQFRHKIFERFELSLGYSLLMSGGLNTNMAYGLDLGMLYYPFSQVEPEVVHESQSQALITELWRPYVGATVNQRQFSGLGFTGFGGNVGSERAFSQDMSFKGEIRYLYLSGSSNVTLKDMDFLLGLTFHFSLFH